MSEHLLDVRDLCISFVGRDGNALEAVNKLNLHIDAGEIVGVVGESGCGKSVFAQSVMRLLEHEQKMAYEGQIVFEVRICWRVRSRRCARCAAATSP